MLKGFKQFIFRGNVVGILPSPWSSVPPSGR